MYRKIRNSEDYIMINTNRPLKFIDLLKRQNIKLNNDYLHDITLLKGHSSVLKVFCWIYSEEYAVDIIRPFRLEYI